MAVSKEMVLYYNPSPAAHVSRLKGVLVQMGIRIKNITPDQTGQMVGYLAGMKGFEVQDAVENPEILEEILVMRGFGNQRIDHMLAAFRKAKVPKIDLKAVVTESNSNWSFDQLYREIKKEHQEMTSRD